jgi:hypothetical protein
MEETIDDGNRNVEISVDLTDTKVILDALIEAHKECPARSRERSLIVTKLQEARMWTLEAQAQE